MRINNKKSVINWLHCLQNDFELLRNGDWSPDDASIDASIEVLTSVIEYVEKQCHCEPATQVNNPTFDSGFDAAL